jgi:hypothetical protein
MFTQGIMGAIFGIWLLPHVRLHYQNGPNLDPYPTQKKLVEFVSCM